MNRLLIAATLALVASAGSGGQARANGNGNLGIGIGLNLGLSYDYSCANAGGCPINYGCDTSFAYPSFACGPSPSGYGGYNPSLGGVPLQGYGVPLQGYGVPPYYAGPGWTPAFPGKYPIRAAERGIHVVAE